MKHILGFIGAGRIAQSLIQGLIDNGFPADRIWVSNPSNKKLALLQSGHGVHTTQDNQKVATVADTLILAIKPQTMSSVANEISDSVKSKQSLVLSLAAGVPMDRLQQWFGKQLPIIRCMPNLPVSVGKGATALYADDAVGVEHRSQAEMVLRTVGIVAWLKEESMDAITALSGSGPSYVYVLMEALHEASEDCGLDKDIAKLFTTQMMLGAIQLSVTSQEDLGELVNQIASPGGTTEAALNVLKERNVAEAFKEAFKAAVERSKSLSKQL